MRTYEIEFTLTERTRRRMTVTADSAEDAVRAVEEYECNDDSYEVDSLEWSISDVEEIPA